MEIRKVTAVKEGDEVVGNSVRVKVVKNKIAPPFRQAEFDILHDRGINRESDIFNLAIEDKLIDKSGSWVSYGEMRLGQGAENAKKYLRENQALAEEITKKILAKRGMLNLASAPAAAAPAEEPKEKEKVETPAPHLNNRKRPAVAATE
jgi:recombination protein RecA